MFGHTGDTFVPLPTPPLSVPSPGNVPLAPDRLPAHPALPRHLALRHPVAAALLAGQEEVTAASPPHHPGHRRAAATPPSPSCLARAGEAPRDRRGNRLTQPRGLLRAGTPAPREGEPPRTADCHRHSQGLASTAGMAKGPAVHGEQGVGSPLRPKRDPGGSPRYRAQMDRLPAGTAAPALGGWGGTATVPVPRDRFHGVLEHPNLPELKLPLQPSPGCLLPCREEGTAVTGATPLRPGHPAVPAGGQRDTVAAACPLPCQPSPWLPGAARSPVLGDCPQIPPTPPTPVPVPILRVPPST